MQKYRLWIGLWFIAVLCLVTFLLQTQVQGVSDSGHDHQYSVDPTVPGAPNEQKTPKRKTDAEILAMQQQLPLPKGHKASRVFVLPSHPTSGTEFIRLFYSKATDLSKATMYPQEGNLTLLKPITEDLDVYVSRPFPPPINGATLMKTHHPRTDHPPFDEIDMSEHFAGIVLLVRNPGDCLLRNAARWYCKNDPIKNCEEANTVKFCSQLKTLGKHWANMYQYWIEKGETYNLPVYILRYEDVIFNQRETFIQLIEFMNKENSNFLFHEDWLDEELQKPENKGQATFDFGTTIMKCSPTDVQLLVESIGIDLLDRFGYVVDFETKTIQWIPINHVIRD